MSILEAMTMGIPIVAPDVGGIKEIIDDGVEGFLVKGRDPQDFAEKCLEIITNDKLRDSMSNAAQDKVIQFFSAEKMAMNYYKLYKLLGDD
jgi:glycosyltransferase involved in cell wall biosynthesis